MKINISKSPEVELRRPNQVAERDTSNIPNYNFYGCLHLGKYHMTVLRNKKQIYNLLNLQHQKYLQCTQLIKALPTIGNL